MSTSDAEVIVIGAGIAGLITALELAPANVTLIANASLGQGVASGWSQGGIAAALAADDKPANHAQDTIYAAAGIADVDAVQTITEEAPAAIEYLSAQGVPFDRSQDGQYALSREAAHSHARVVRVSGDRTGPGIMAALAKKIEATSHIHRLMDEEVIALISNGNGVKGVWVRNNRTGAIKPIVAKAVVLATGGTGHLYRATSNPHTANGVGIAIAARAGAILADLEFVQFHPTTLAVGKDPSPLATEALRGEGAILINEKDERFMVSQHPMAELAPRDIVARSIFREIQSGHKAYLDCTKAIGEEFPSRFPQVFALCAEAGINPVQDPIPVEPAAHYHMGGIATNQHGKTTIDGLWACGEVACTGAHGANRLASNSLLEAIVYARRIAKNIKDYLASYSLKSENGYAPPQTALPADAESQIKNLRSLMTDYVGVIRNEAGLLKALSLIQEMERNEADLLSNMILTSKTIVVAALLRTESRGSHFRSDFPVALDHFKYRRFFTLDEIEKTAHKLLSNGSPKKISSQ